MPSTSAPDPVADAYMHVRWPSLHVLCRFVDAVFQLTRISLDTSLVSAPSNPVPNLPKPKVARAQPTSAAVESSHDPSGERVDSSGPGGDVPIKVAQAVEPATKLHAPVEEHDERKSRSKKERERERATRDALLAKSGITRIHSWISRLRWTQLRCHRLLHLLNRHPCGKPRKKRMR